MKKTASLICLLVSSLIQGAQVTLDWCPSPDTNVTGYTFHIGEGYSPGWMPQIVSTNSPCGNEILFPGTNWFRTYTQQIAVGNVTNITVTNLVVGRTYYFTVTAHDEYGKASDYCNEVQYTVPILDKLLPPSNLRTNVP